VFAGVPRLKSATEKSYSTESAATYGKIEELILAWELQADEDGDHDRTIYLMAERRLHPTRADLRYWKAKLYSHREKDTTWIQDPSAPSKESCRVIAPEDGGLARRRTGVNPAILDGLPTPPALHPTSEHPSN
jgi:hypothetical protein